MRQMLRHFAAHAGPRDGCSYAVIYGKKMLQLASLRREMKGELRNAAGNHRSSVFAMSSRLVVV
jgi:hypothetical protein